MPCELARQAVTLFVIDRVVMGLPSRMPELLQEVGGAFVCIKTRDGELRGCIGTVEASRPSRGHEIVHNAIGAATRDNRFLPIGMADLPLLQYTVDLILPLQPIDDARALAPERYGLLVRSEGRTGVLLPGIPEIRDGATQLRLACRKAGIGARERLNLYRFEVLRHQETPCQSA
ncbi:MAG: AmmeMemoRadiSam system protein A [Candidatus Xenobia bacterium]